VTDTADDRAPALAEDLRLALELADLADAITMRRYRAADLVVETKPDLTPVTEADRAVEQAIRDRLASVRPDDAVIGEEYGGGERPAGGRRWIIDPIDGTKSYVRGMATWSTLIGLEAEGQVSVGVVSMPALARRWWAQRGAGAFADGRQIHVSGVARLDDAVMTWSGIEDWDAVGRFDAIVELGRKCWRTRGLGDAWQYMLVAEGSAEIALDPEVKIWDLAALQVIIEEAGGRFTDFTGVPRPDGGDGIATNGLVHEAALAIIGR
jgi:histidinol-phosphatase